MSEHFKDEPTSPAVTEQQIPHSGTLPESLREQPVRDFDNTSLPEAYEQGHLVTPESPAPLLDAHEAPAKKNRKGLLIGLGATGAGIALAAGAVFGVNALNQAPKTEPTAAAPADPSETPAEASPPASPEVQTFTAEQLEIPAGLDAETLGKTIVADRWSEWLNAGATNELRWAAHDVNESWDEFLPKMVDNNREVFADALYVPGWQSNENLLKDITTTRNANLANLQWYVATAWSGDQKPQNKEGYRSWLTVELVQELEDHVDETRTIEVTYSNANNSTMNDGPAPDPGGIFTITTKVVDGKEKIAEVHLRSRS